MKFFPLFLILLGVGCDTSSSLTHQTTDGGGSDGGNTFSGGGEGGSASSTSSGGAALDACAQFVSCMYAVEPTVAADADAAYGSQGSCWQTQTAEACTDSCWAALETLHTAYPDTSACALCVSDTDCGTTSPACATEIGECVGCTSATHCKSPTPACDLSNHVCVECTTSSDCDSALPECDSSTHSCVECATGIACDSGACNNDNTCCVEESPCSGSRCGEWETNCGNTVNCGGCDDGSYCDDLSNECEPIEPTYGCTYGGESETCTKYEEYCNKLQNGPSYTVWCEGVPEQCLTDFTCTCLKSAGAYYSPDTCSAGSGENGEGTLYVTHN